MKTGLRQITLTSLIFVQAPNPDAATNWPEDLVAGTTLTARVTLVMDFDADFETASGTITTELFLPFQDPLIDAPFLCLAGTDDWRRVPVFDDVCP